MGFFKNIFTSKVPSTTKIDEIDYSKIDKIFFRSNYFSPRVPLLIKGGANGWPMIKNWTKDYIIDKYGEYKCTVISDSRPAHSKLKTNLADYFINHKGKSTLTLDFDPMKSVFFLKGLKFPNIYFSKKEIHRFFFYHSIKEAGTLPHVHRDAFNILRKGKKRWIMHDANQNISPVGFKLLKESYVKYPPGTHAKDWFKKELNRVSKKVELFECYQTDMDIVYVPENYCHTVINISDEVLGIVVETLR
jgi:hypothetical protein